MRIVLKDSLFKSYVVLICSSQTIAMNSHKTPIRLRWFLWLTTIRALALLTCVLVKKGVLNENRVQKQEYQKCYETCTQSEVSWED